MGYHKETRAAKLIGYGAGVGPGHSPSAIAAQTGISPAQFRRFEQARRRYTFSQVLTGAECMELQPFVMARRGSAHSFLLRDPLDYTTASDEVSAFETANVLIGTGDGTETEFQLKKIYTEADGTGTYNRIITKPVAGTVVVSVNGATQTLGTHYTIDHQLGRVSFLTAPTNPHPVRAGFEFRVLVRFDKSVDSGLAFTRVGPDHYSVALACTEEKTATAATDRVEAGSDLVCYGGATQYAAAGTQGRGYTEVDWTTYAEHQNRYVEIAATGYYEVRLPDVGFLNTSTTSTPAFVSGGLFDSGRVVPGGPYFAICNTGTSTIALKEWTTHSTDPSLSAWTSLVACNPTIPAGEIREVYLDSMAQWRGI